MAGGNGSLQQNPTVNSLFAASLDPRSLIVSQFSNFDQPLQLTMDSFFMERGPRYDDYAALRESKLRRKQQVLTEEDDYMVTPPKKQVKFQGNFATPPKRTKGSSVLTQSVPDFSSALRKENRKPTTKMLPPLTEKSMLPPLMEKSLTPPLKSKSGRFEAIIGRMGGSKSVNSSEKKGGLMARKSYASLDELKGLASNARSGINGENRAGRTSSTRAGVGKNVLGYRQC